MVKWIKEVRFIHSAKEKAALAEMEKALARESVGRVLANGSLTRDSSTFTPYWIVSWRPDIYLQALPS